VQVVNTGDTTRWSVQLQLTITPVAGSAVRPLDSTLLLTYEFASQYRDLTYETRGNTLVATTPALSTVDPGATAEFRLRIASRPTSAAAHVDEMTVNIATAALDSSGTVFATDPEPDRVALVEPRTELTGWPERPVIGTPAVVTVSITNTTPLEYLILRPTLAMYRAGNDQVVIERRDGDEWTRVEGPTNNYNWWYADSYPSLQPGETYTATLRVTFTDEAAAGEQGFVYHIGYTFFGFPIAVDGHAYTLEPAV
jgi:hypothetical protein